MKKIYVILGMIITLLSCGSEPVKEYIVLSGTIINKDIDSIGIVTTDRAVKLFKKKIKVSDNGNFRDTLYVDDGHYNYFDGKRAKSFYLQKGSQVNISLDTKDIESTFQITGDRIEIANYIVRKEKKKKEILGDGFDYFKENETVFLEKIKNVKNTIKNLLDTTEGIPDTFKNLETKNIQYEYALNLLNYENYHAYFKKQKFKVSSDFPNPIKEDFSYHIEEDYVFSESYKKLLLNKYKEEAKEYIKKDSISRGEALLKAVATNSNERIKNDLLFYIARSSISGDKYLKQIYNTFIDNSTHKENNTNITDIYTRLEKVAVGSPSPKFVKYENAKGGTTSLDDLKGKYVYIDVWATWCGPCKKEIPYLKKVEKQYHDKNIEFVSVSVDVEEKRKAWINMVTDKEMTGIQLLADKAFKSDFIKDYAITGIPRFLLIDPEGNIVSANAPRPSDTKLIDLFNQLKI